MTSKRLAQLNSFIVLGTDQSSITERNAQVKLMGQIYRNAHRVLIWLGEEDEQTSGAFAYLRLLALCLRAPPLLRFAKLVLDSLSRTERKFGNAWEGTIHSLYNREWFSRLCTKCSSNSESGSRNRT